MFLSDSLLTSQDIDGCRQMFSACIFCFDVARQSCDCLILLRWRQVDPGRCVWCRRVRQGPNIPGGTSLLIRGGCVLCTLVDLYSLAVLQWAQNYKTYHWRIQPLLLLHSLNLVILQTRPWLDDIFNLFVQRSLAYWGKEKKKREMSGKKDEPSSKHICVRRCPMCCSNLWEHLCLWHEGAFITFLLSPWQENAGRRISMRHLGNASRCGRPTVARRGTINTSASHFENPQCWHQDAQTLPSKIGLKKRSKQGKQTLKWRCPLCSLG